MVDDPETQFVSFPPSEADGDLAVLLRTQDLVRPGILAIQSPYDTERYVAADGAITEFTVEKFLFLTRLAKLLGAKRVIFEDVRADQSKSSANARATAKNVAVSVDSSAAVRSKKDLRERLKGEHCFPGSVPDIDGARKLLASTRLAGDPQLVALVELRSGDNAIERQEIRFSGTRESAANLNAALRIAGGPGKLKLAGFSSDLAHQWESKLQIEVWTLIEFYAFGPLLMAVPILRSTTSALRAEGSRGARSSRRWPFAFGHIRREPRTGICRDSSTRSSQINQKRRA